MLEADTRSMNKQREIERLLRQIRQGVRELELLRVRGARGRLLMEREQELMRDREQLAHIVAHAGDDDARTTSSTGRTTLRATPSGRSSRSIAHSAAIVPSS